MVVIYGDNLDRPLKVLPIIFHFAYDFLHKSKHTSHTMVKNPYLY